MIEGLTPDIIIALVGVTFIAGFIDAIAGGGGLLTIPAFLLAGLSPAQAIATNKVQAVFGSASAAFAFARAKMIDWKAARTGFFCSLAGAALGSFVLIHVNPDILRDVIPFVLIALALYFALAPNLNDEPRRHLISAEQHGIGAGGAIGFYDGLFGPGTGSFFAVSFVTLLGYGIKKATAHAKLFNFASNTGSLVVFLIMGKAAILLGLLMAVGQVCGAMLGAQSAIKHGAKLIRPLLVVMCCAMALRLLLN